MLRAVERLTEIGGGQVVAEGSHITTELPLPVAGLMSDKPVIEVAQAEDKLIKASSALGSSLSDPFMALSFLALPVIPRLKLTDKGLVDVDRFVIVSLYS
jgi:adenine deaminase